MKLRRRTMPLDGGEGLLKRDDIYIGQNPSPEKAFVKRRYETKYLQKLQNSYFLDGPGEEDGDVERQAEEMTMATK